VGRGVEGGGAWEMGECARDGRNREREGGQWVAAGEGWGQGY